MTGSYHAKSAREPDEAASARRDRTKRASARRDRRRAAEQDVDRGSHDDERQQRDANREDREERRNDRDDRDNGCDDDHHDDAKHELQDQERKQDEAEQQVKREQEEPDDAVDDEDSEREHRHDRGEDESNQHKGGQLDHRFSQADLRRSASRSSGVRSWSVTPRGASGGRYCCGVSPSASSRLRTTRECRPLARSLGRLKRTQKPMKSARSTPVLTANP